MFEVLEHTADIGFRARGRTRSELFASAAEALARIAYEAEGVEPREPYDLSAEGPDLESLLVNWLGEVLYLIDGQRIVPLRFEVTELGPRHVAGRALGEPRDPARHRAKLIVKGVTYHQLEIVEPSFFFTVRRWQQLERALRDRGEPVPRRPAGVPAHEGRLPQEQDDDKLGTVGVVALDSRGDVAAGTSTGGTNAKRWGRIGDSPIVGAGTYAANESCAVSGTGAGEFFIRLTVARDVPARLARSSCVRATSTSSTWSLEA